MAYHYTTTLKIATAYAKSVDERILKIKNIKQRKTSSTLIILDPLPPSGMLYSAEIKNDTSDFRNKEMKLAFELASDLSVKK